MSKKDKTEKKESSSKIKISGIAFWAHVHEVNRLSNKFQMDLSIDSRTARILEDVGIETKEEKDQGDGKKRGENVGTDKDRGTFVTLKSSYPPSIVDAGKNKVSSSVLIGNGSKVNVITHPYNWTFGKDKGTSAGLDAIQILELVEFKSDMADMFSEEEGFTSADISSNEDFDDESGEVKTPVKSTNNPF